MGKLDARYARLKNQPYGHQFRKYFLFQGDLFLAKFLEFFRFQFRIISNFVDKKKNSEFFFC
jgi:hypothetical protein